MRGYILSDYTEASHSVYEEDEATEISFFADKASVFDLRTYDIVSTFSFDDRTKPACSIRDGKIIFNTACNKALGTGQAEILFHPSKTILALRTSTGDTPSKSINETCITKPVHLSHFVPIALESARLKSEYRYRIYGTRRTKNDECIMLFDLLNAEITPPKKDTYILPSKYVERYGNGYYENITACGLHKIDIDGLWQALHESKPADSLAGQVIELTEFCQNSLTDFELLEEINHE